MGLQRDAEIRFGLAVRPVRVCLHVGQVQVHWGAAREHEELYDLVADPDETENIAATSGEEIAAIKERLKRYFEIDEILDLVPTKEVILNEKQRKMLKALGYLND